MKIGVVGELRFPVLPYGPGGLGRTTHMFASGLAALGHSVVLYAPHGSEFDGEINSVELDPKKHDVVLDLTHDHEISKTFPDYPIENLVCDRECDYVPPCAVVESRFMRKTYIGAKIVPASIEVEKIPYFDTPLRTYLVFMALMHPLKGVQDAIKAASMVGVDLRLIGPGGDAKLPNYLGPIYDNDAKWAQVGNALGILCPYKRDAAPRTPLEAAACGTPTICFNQDGTCDTVEDGVSGFVCLNTWEMAERISDLATLERKKIRNWVIENHNFSAVIKTHEKLLVDICCGIRW